MYTTRTKFWEDKYVIHERMRVFNDNNEEMSHGTFATEDSMFCGKYVKSLLVGGIGTEPQYRRNGCVRAMLEETFSLAPERGWAVSLLHPFSSAYYRKFGYEKIADHKIVEFPMSFLSHIPRCPDLVPYTYERLNDVLSLYAQFSKKRNIMFRRYSEGKYSTDRRKIFIRYDEKGTPVGYIILRVENYYDVNRMVSVNLHVEELVFTTPQSLIDLFGFIRMYEGELDSVKIHNCAMSPEVDNMLREYVNVKYTLVSDIMARVLDVKAMLLANAYPKEQGHFRIYVDDILDFTRGTWEVEYADGTAEVKKLSDDAKYDIYLPMPAFTQILYGYEQYDEYSAAFMPGVKVNGECSDFFRAFPKRYNGLFEHF